MIQRAMCILLGILMIPWPVTAAVNVPGFYGTVTSALPQVAPTQVPVLKPAGSIQGLDPSTPYYIVPGTNKAVVNQVESRAIIDWSEFNIGKDAWVHFDQQDASWAALNRIWDGNPSQIYGRLTAPGAVYLINQNGILFSPTAQVNVHSLIASSLNIQNNDFLNNVLKFKAENYNGLPDNLIYDPDTNMPGVVANCGTITTEDEGSVFLMGPQVENHGTITSNIGQIGLVAGTDVELQSPIVDTTLLTYPGGDSRLAKVVVVKSSPEGSSAWNAEGGFLAADTGLVGMYGRIVNQDGLIRSVTAVKTGGHVELFASEKISTGANSWIALPVSTSTEAIHTSFSTAQGSVTFSGLDSNSPSDPGSFVKQIEHRGQISAPSGLVTMNAVDRIYLESGSSIDVSGLWVYRTGNEGLLEVQMNSSNLRDEFMQKGGVLQGQTITMSSLYGSSIGDVSGAFSSEALTAVERHTEGGTITLNTAGKTFTEATGDIIVKDGATIDFSGGGFRYGAGSVDVTTLVSGNTVYDISTADPQLHYDAILNLQTVVNQRFGTVEVYRGINYGGANPVMNYVQQHVVGSDAGSLSLYGTQIVLNGTLLGHVEKGLLQTLTAEPTSEEGTQTKSGYVEPIAGKLYIGGDTNIANSYANTSGVNLLTQEIVVAAEGTSLPADFGPDTPLPSSSESGLKTTVLSAKTLSDAGLNSIYLATNTSLVIEKGAQITLQSGGSFIGRARSIEEYGEIVVHGGTITLAIESNLTTEAGYDVLAGPQITIGETGRLIVSGETLDTTALGVTASSGTTLSGHLDGGSIEIMDKTPYGKGVVIAKGAVLDVSGGWEIDAPSEVTGGDAGTLMLQGSSLSLEGSLLGYSLYGNEGGTINLHASSVFVGAPEAAPEGDFGLFLDPHRLDQTGFTQITLASVKDVVMAPGVSLAPSLWKLSQPIPGQAQGAVTAGVSTASPAIYQVSLDEIGTSSITMNAGQSPESGNLTDPNYSYLPAWSMAALYEENAQVSMPSGAKITVAPGGTISLAGPSASINGVLTAQAGTISVAATNTLGNLFIGSEARLIAEGYNKLDTSASIKGLAVEATAMAGGEITLTSERNLILAEGSLLSVSGAAPVQRTFVGTDGVLVTTTDGGDAGSITLKGSDGVQLGGTLIGLARREGAQGGTLSIETETNSTPLSVSVTDLARFRDSGFDALSLANNATDGVLQLDGTGQVAFGRSLTLSAPVITGSGSVELSAPWVQVTNNAASLSSVSVPAEGDAEITLSGTWLDITGNVVFSGFRNVALKAERDLRLTDAEYVVGAQKEWSGELRTSGDLLLQAAWIYPTTLTDFLIEADYGKVTILPSGTTVDGYIYSAGGSLTIKAAGGIDHRGYLAAPMGSITLDAGDGRVYLAEGSVTTVKGEDITVKYGDFQADLGEDVWGILDKLNSGSKDVYTAVEAAPDKTIQVKGSEVIIRDGALMDLSGGGSVFTYEFQAWTSGTTNPLSGCYVIMPDNSIVLPGPAVYLAGGNGLKPGVYSLLPAEYAFLPGAMVITALDMTLSPGDTPVTSEGYAIIGGYSTVMGTGISSNVLKGYEVRMASDVLKEGNFLMQTATAGDAGSLSVAGKTTLLGGTILAGALSGYSGGTVALSGTNIVVQQLSSAIAYPDNFDFSTPLTGALEDYKDHLYIAASAISDKGFKTVALGVTDPRDAAGTITAESVTVEEDVTIQAENVILGATDLIDVQKNARILALAPEGSRGEASLLTPDETGRIVVGEGALVHASDAINLGKVDIELQGTLLADNSEINLWSTLIAFGARQSDEKGIFFSEATKWNDLVAAFENIGLRTNDLEFRTTFTFKDPDTQEDLLDPVRGTLTIDTPSVKSLANEEVKLSAVKAVYLLNSSGTEAAGSKGTGVITLEAPEMVMGSGSVTFDALATLNLNAANNVIFQGAGALQTGGADLNITTSRVTTSYYMESAGASDLDAIYTAANFLIDTTNQTDGTAGSISLLAGSGTAGTETTPGGSLEIVGSSIDVSTLVEMPSGQLTMTASDNISLNNGASLLLQGTADAPGGSVSLKSTDNGSITIADGSLIDVSAGTQGDAGSISLYAPEGGVTLAGTIKGDADGGRGGSFTMVTDSIDDFGALNQKLKGASQGLGGFDETIDIRTRTGDIAILLDETVHARNVKLTADDGTINLSGTVDVSYAGQGGTAELYARNINVSGTILGRGTGTDATGGDVILGEQWSTRFHRTDQRLRHGRGERRDGALPPRGV
jgi:filamentous hemagglutinin family protein